MKKRGRTFVELRNGIPIRIFRVVKYESGGPETAEWSRMGAVSAIRQQVFDRAAGHCERCGTPITTQTGHMHETVPRSKGGEISIFNSVALCAPCHIGPAGVHKNKFPKWTRKDQLTF